MADGRHGIQVTRTVDGMALARDGRDYLRFGWPKVQGRDPDRVEASPVEGPWQRISLGWTLNEEVKQDAVAVEFDVLFEPEFHWMPHLAPDDGFVVGQHVFRSPAIIMAAEDVVAILVPDLDLVGRNPGAPWFLDLAGSPRAVRVVFSDGTSRDVFLDGAAKLPRDIR